MALRAPIDSRIDLKTFHDIPFDRIRQKAEAVMMPDDPRERPRDVRSVPDGRTCREHGRGKPQRPERKGSGSRKSLGRSGKDALNEWSSAGACSCTSDDPASGAVARPDLPSRLPQSRDQGESPKRPRFGGLAVRNVGHDSAAGTESRWIGGGAETGAWVWIPEVRVAAEFAASGGAPVR